MLWPVSVLLLLNSIKFCFCFSFTNRYIDDIFFTWNESEEKAKAILEAANKFHTNIKLTYTIGKIVPFLDILLSNQNGILHSSVYHKPAAQPTFLSFLSDHPRHVFRNVVQTALMRTIRYSSTFDAFNIEQRQIRLKLLYNGYVVMEYIDRKMNLKSYCFRYPSTYINTQFQHFFDQYLPTSSSFPTLIPFIDEHQFFLVRQKLLAQPTRQQAEVAKRLGDIEITNPVVLNGLGVAQPNPQPIPLVTMKRKDNKFSSTLFVHCKHEARLAGVKRNLHKIHDDIFKNTAFGDIRLIVGHRNNPDIDYELSRKCPPSYLLKDQPKRKSKYFYVND
jgi:hypothetical protein